MDNEIRRLRGERGLSQAALGEALGVSRQTVNSLEAGRYDPSLPLALALGRFFGMPVEDLFHLPDGGDGG
ncbi:helix-turn-helix transcriptional regulator [Phycicoccus sp. BSK3Z-2]|uniref:Helix-turn-helix transcriptional regulator n=1 Tax=Phycicoccus avicenniae TaxID=2828860 RepID=A0A941D749_9MICO|nr:helix-turn-helix transcriptional regulator [Phycicoccus avicenniae]MBR7743334.1 helix-turn-helix transcriptional regulator [Phycicoccus avicenniae]